MFGSDWPVCLLSAAYTEVIELVDDYLCGVPLETRQKVFGENAVNFYQLKCPHDK
jgi:L-fuconolactonase